MSVKKMLDASGSVVRVGKLIGQGGEGAVYEVVAASNRVAKIYHNAISPNRARKIQVMASLYSDVIARSRRHGQPACSRPRVGNPSAY